MHEIIKKNQNTLYITNYVYNYVYKTEYIIWDLVKITFVIHKKMSSKKWQKHVCPMLVVMINTWKCEKCILREFNVLSIVTISWRNTKSSPFTYLHSVCFQAFFLSITHPNSFLWPIKHISVLYAYMHNANTNLCLDKKNKKKEI